MKLAVSNIAWPASCHHEAFALLAASGIAGVEVAPTTIWPEWKNITPASLRAFRQTVLDAGLEIAALQAILFQKPDLQLFGDETSRRALRNHLHVCAGIAAALGAQCVVFGAPKNRLRGSLSETDALNRAAELFAEIAPVFASNGTCLVFEPNPAVYGCDFATASHTAAHLVRTVNSAGFRLHLDTACLHLAGEDPAQAIPAHWGHLAHFHVSEAHLGPFDSPQLNHPAAAQSLQSYRHWISLEMRCTATPLESLHQAAAYLRRTYGSC